MQNNFEKLLFFVLFNIRSLFKTIPAMILGSLSGVLVINSSVEKIRCNFYLAKGMGQIVHQFI
jgi:hypothetical protein